MCESITAMCAMTIMASQQTVAVPMRHSVNEVSITGTGKHPKEQLFYGQYSSEPLQAITTRQVDYVGAKIYCLHDR